MTEQPRVKGGTIIVTPEVMSLIEWAKEVAWFGRRVSRGEALEWLLRDLCEYGSPVVGHQARKTWPECVETKEWERKHPPRSPRDVSSD